ncbi:unnamed protein product [Ectocarpus sp. 12 AP-2014]
MTHQNNIHTPCVDENVTVCLPILYSGRVERFFLGDAPLAQHTQNTLVNFGMKKRKVLGFVGHALASTHAAAFPGTTPATPSSAWKSSGIDTYGQIDSRTTSTVEKTTTTELTTRKHEHQAHAVPCLDITST